MISATAGGISKLLHIALCAVTCSLLLPTAVGDDLGPPIHFVAEMSADEQSAYTESQGRARAEFTLDRATLRLSWTLTYAGITSAPLGAAIHGPQSPGGNAGVLIDMGDKNMHSPLKGSAVLTDGQLEYLLTGRSYVNLRTEKHRLGELRGQIVRQP
jgi:hypothetical protein